MNPTLQKHGLLFGRICYSASARNLVFNVQVPHNVKFVAYNEIAPIVYVILIPHLQTPNNT
jgi:hypothetical protein